ncbi:DUF1947 domain-containing protein [archaeon]|jgi:PUA-domain protein|nr:DUF1947 domain-containing protein [archaeon]MBT3451537.1 DUF1947 domain-containing protein [archaeon]MBT6869396.1 DUF1947 domain-containing protein [archaeon]MBT7192559.1 DUF1947 domain-containing protein [archaeon]MBT7380635.1 DUF1947 domain-containing protein [archaeon]
MKKTRIKSKDLNKELEYFGFNIEYSKKDKIESLESKDKELKGFAVNDQLSFFYSENKLIPNLKILQDQPNLLKQITIDMGAIKFIINGADIMRPGIVEIEEGINKDSFIVIVDVNNKKPLAVGIALFSSEEMKDMDSGKVIKNIHYVGDDVWERS